MSDATRESHPVANLFPLMVGDDFAALAEDVKSNGLLEPIWLHPDGRVIDGRNRYKACRAVDVEPSFRTWSGEGSLVEFIVSLNLHRRHLTSSQRAMAALDAEPLMAEEAAERHSRAAVEANRRRAEPSQPERLLEDVPASQIVDQPADPNERKSSHQAAKLLGTNRQYVSDAKNLKAERPDLAEQVKSGEMSLPEAKRQSNSALYTSNSPEWYTPQDIISRVEASLGGIDLDPCSNSHGSPAVPAAHHFVEADDGLAKEWFGTVYMNPPYGRGIDEWVQKLDAAYQAGRVTQAVALLPARVDTRWFRILRDYAVCFINGRLRFSGADPAPFPSAAFYLGTNEEAFAREFGAIGDLYRRFDAEEAA